MANAARASAGAAIPLVGLLVAAVILAVRFGSEPVSAVRAITDPQSVDRIILVDVRLPRVALAALAGGGLAAVGGAYQALLRNPLAEPFVLGVSGGAALGATTVIALGLGASTLLGAALIPAAAFLGGLGATLLVYSVARDARSGSTGTSILLAGVMVNAVASALITAQKTLVSPSRALQLLRWLTGAIDLPSPLALLLVAVYVIAGIAVLLADAGRLNLLALGDETAETLGIDVHALERRIFLASSCVVGAIVSVTGMIGFVGLVVPHVVRRLSGPDHRRLLPFSILLGASALVLCDLAARLVLRWTGDALPVGAVTALLGAPVFLVLLRRSTRLG
jgi:iron complex transport system permease protein